MQATFSWPQRFIYYLLPGLFLFCIAAAQAATGLYTVKSLSGVGSTLGGYVIPRYEVILSAQMPGTVTFIKGGAGTRFVRGEVLAGLDQSVLRAKRLQAVAQYDAALAAWENARAQLAYGFAQNVPPSASGNPFASFGSMFGFNQGFSSLMGQGVNNPYATYESQLTNRRYQAAMAWAKVQASKAAIQEIDTNLQHTLSVAPFDGIVLFKKVNVGDSVQPGMPLLVVASTGQRQIEVKVPDALAEELKVGEALWANLSSQPRAIATTVAVIYPEANPQTHTVTIKLNLPQDIHPRIGSYVQVTFPAYNMPQVPVIPMSALLQGHILPTVLVVKNGTSVIRVLRLGQPLQGGVVQVLAGLHDGEVIVDNPPPGAKAGYLPGGSATASSAEHGR